MFTFPVPVILTSAVAVISIFAPAVTLNPSVAFTETEIPSILTFVAGLAS